MESIGKLERRALVVGEFMVDCSDIFETVYLPELSCAVQRFEYGIEAARAIKRESYPLIVLPCRVAPGLNPDSASDLPEMVSIWNQMESFRGVNKEEEVYFSLSLQLCRYARQGDSANKKSLIVFADTYHPDKDELITNVRERVIGAGADTYLNMIEPTETERFFHLAQTKLGWRRK